MVQGITEFLPVSSSGHLVILQDLLGWRGPRLEFDVAVHGGTLLAILLFFRSDIGEILRHPLGRRGWLIVVGTVPTALIGLLVHTWGRGVFSSAPLAASFLVLTGCLLWLTRGRDRHGGDQRTEAWKAFLIGVAQGVAVLPGVSRSGATISVGMLLGLERRWAGEFSFLLAIPAIMGAMLLEAKEMASAVSLPLIVGTICAFASGYGALKLLFGMIRRGKFYLFAPYCWALGMGYLLLRALS